MVCMRLVHVSFTLLALPLQYAACVLHCDPWHDVRAYGAWEDESRSETSFEMTNLVPTEWMFRVIAYQL